MPSSDPDAIRRVIDALAKEKLSSLPTYSQTAGLVQALARAIKDWAVAFDEPPSHAELHFVQALAWVDKLQNAANPLTRSGTGFPFLPLRKALEKDGQKKMLEQPEGWMWRRLNLERAIKDSKSSAALWHVDLALVSECAASYLYQPWSKVAVVEQLMAELLVYTATLRFAQSGVFGEFGLFVRLGWLFVKGAVRLAAILFVAYGATEANGLWLGLLAAAAMVFLLESITPASKKNARLLGEMQSVYQVLCDPFPCPALIRERVIATSNLGVVWPSGLPNLIEHSFRRNAERWE